LKYSAEQAKKVIDDLNDICVSKPSLDFQLDYLACRLQKAEAVTHLRQGLMRRLGMIDKASRNIFTIHRPGREDILSKDELQDVDINLHAFVINVYGVLDNVAWVCALENGFLPTDHNKRDVGLFNKKMREHLPGVLLSYIDEEDIQNWFKEFAKEYRDSTVHRIPPYHPPSLIYTGDIERYKQLEQDSWEALFGRHDVDRHEVLKKEQQRLLHISPFMALGIEGDRPMFMHYQIVCDRLTINELLKKFLDGMADLLQIEYPDYSSIVAPGLY